MSPHRQGGLLDASGNRLLREKWGREGGECISKSEVTVFYNLISEVTAHHFCHILSIRSESLGPANTLQG